MSRTPSTPAPARAPFGVAPRGAFSALASALLPLAIAAAPPPAAAADTLVTYPNIYFDLYAPTTAETDEAASHVRQAQRGFGATVGERTPRITVVAFASDSVRRRHDLERLRRRGFPLVVWTSPPGELARRTPAALTALALRENLASLAHDIGHAFLEAYADRRLRELGLSGGPTPPAPPPGAHRDHAALPDWFEEGFAALCEFPQVQQARLRAMRQTLDRRLPFTRLFAMSRPADPAAAALFANQSYALLHMVTKVETGATVNEIAIALLRGRPVGEALTNARHLLSKPEALEAQWVEWMTANVPAPAAAPAAKGARGAPGR
uniref:DUF1570 domain-containing protein n=1 Tax=Eiseniibacteriota bacterium TaxID=2212470 RepID=A0A832MN19_UNCEI